MTIRRFLTNKLIRNKGAENLLAEGVKSKITVLSDNDMFLEAITQKMIEELEEVFSSESQEELLEEIADFEEVFAEFKKLVQISDEDVAKARADKNSKKGNFSERIFSEYIDIPETSTRALTYVQGKPDKYPELNPKTNDLLHPEFFEEEDEDDEEDYE